MIERKTKRAFERRQSAGRVGAVLCGTLWCCAAQCGAVRCRRRFLISLLPPPHCAGVGALGLAVLCACAVLLTVVLLPPLYWYDLFVWYPSGSLPCRRVFFYT